mgnify:CR=1 FL=1
MRVMLDTTFVIDYLREKPEAVDRLRSIYETGDEPLVTSVVVSRNVPRSFCRHASRSTAPAFSAGTRPATLSERKPSPKLSGVHSTA